MEFKAHCMSIDLDPTGIVKPLLRKVKQLADLSQAPEGRGDCSNCSLVDTLV
jgi:hypothetical protein